MAHHHGITRAALDRDDPYDEFFDRHNHTAVPVLVQWMVTLRCTLSCPHCLTGGARCGPELSTSEAGRLLDEVARMGVRELLLTGGEPLERQDLPDVIAMMKERSIRWSLNTSVHPDRRAIRAMESHPPAFAAVSLDGPEPFHDRFRGKAGAHRESLAALSLYAELTGGNAAASTTVHALNFPLLEETLAIVMASRASSWGLHLTFPEGRARHHDGLALTRRQLERLLGFVESRRHRYPVVLADEIGFCGEWEPALRAAPFFCGAGRAQCVVLADGEVVPCTTVDTAESAGNVRERPLGEIWRLGFPAIRHHVPRGKCAGCEYLPACGGGCWLQRRHGTHCFRDVWGSWKRVAAPASIVACLAACGAPQPAPVAPLYELGETEEEAADDTMQVISPEPPPDKLGTGLGEAEVTDPEILEHAVIAWHMKKACRHHSVVELTPGQAAKLAKDPAGRYLASIGSAGHPDKIEERTKLVMEALETELRSLGFLSLLWADVTRLSLDGPAPGERTAEQTAMLVEAIEAIAAKADLWRKQIYANQLDSFLSAPPSGRHHFFMLSKAMIPGEAFKARKAEMSMEHWGMEDIEQEITEKHLEEHPFGGHMGLEYATKKKKGTLGIFDVMKTGKSPVDLAFTSGGSTYEVKLQPKRTYLFGDVLRLLYEQNRDEMDAIADKSLVSHSVPDPGPLWLPALEEKMHELAQEDKSDVCSMSGLLLDIWIF